MSQVRFMLMETESKCLARLLGMNIASARARRVVSNNAAALEFRGIVFSDAAEPPQGLARPGRAGSLSLSPLVRSRSYLATTASIKSLEARSVRFGEWRGATRPY